MYRRNSPANTWSVTANRQAPELLIANAPAFSFLGSTGYLSVAQGGRRLALGAQPYVLLAGAWQSSASVPDADLVFYAERDTLHARSRITGARADLEVRINGGSWRNVTQSLPAGAFASGFATSGWHIAPTGDLAVVDWEFQRTNPLRPHSEGRCTPDGGTPTPSSSRHCVSAARQSDQRESGTLPASAAASARCERDALANPKRLRGSP